MSAFGDLVTDTPQSQTTSSPADPVPVANAFGSVASGGAAPEAPAQEPAFNILGKAMTRQDLEKYDSGKQYLASVEADKKGVRGFGEAVTDFDRTNLPGVGGVLGIKQTLAVKDTFRKLNDGEDVSDEERVQAAATWQDMQRKSAEGVSGIVGDVLRQMPGFAAEIGIYSALGSVALGPGTAAGGIFGFFKGASGIVAKPIVNMAVRRMATKLALKETEKAGSEVLASIAGKAFAESYMGKIGSSAKYMLDAGATITLQKVATQAAANILQGENLLENNFSAQRRLERVMSGSNDEQETLSRMMGLGNDFVENASEMAGPMLDAAFAPVTGKLLTMAGRTPGEPTAAWMNRILYGKPIEGDLAKEAARVASAKRMQNASFLGGMAAKLAETKLISLDKAYARLQKLGYHGWAEEIGEERVGDFMKGFMGVSGTDDEGNPEWGVRNAFEQLVPSMKQLEAEAIAFAIPLVTVAWAKRGQVALRGGYTKSAQEVDTMIRGSVPGDSVSVAETYDAATGEKGEPVVTPSVERGEQPTIKETVDAAVARYNSEDEAKPLGLMGNVMSRALTLVESVVTGQFSLHPNTSPSARLLADHGIEAYPKIYGGMYRGSLQRSGFEDPTKATPEAKELADKLGRETVAELIAARRGTLAVGNAVAEAVKAHLAGQVDATGTRIYSTDDLQNITPATLAKGMQEMADKGKLRKYSVLGSTIYAVPSDISFEPESGPQAMVLTALARLGVAVDSGKDIHVDDKGQRVTPQTVAQIARIGSMRVSFSDLEDVIQNPQTSLGLRLAKLGGISLDTSGVKSKDRQARQGWAGLTAWLRETLDTARQLNATVYNSVDGKTSFKLIQHPGADALVTIEPLNEASWKMLEGTGLLQRRVTNQRTGEVSLTERVPFSAAVLGLGLGTGYHAPEKVEAVNFSTPMLLSATDPVVLARSLDYGFKGSDAETEKEVAEHFITHLAKGMQDPVSKRWYVHANALNDAQSLSVSFSAASQLAMLEDMVERVRKRRSGNASGKQLTQTEEALRVAVLKALANASALGLPDARDIQNLAKTYSPELFSKMVLMYGLGGAFSTSNGRVVMGPQFANDVVSKALMALPELRQYLAEFAQEMGIYDHTNKAVDLMRLVPYMASDIGDGSDAIHARRGAIAALWGANVSDAAPAKPADGSAKRTAGKNIVAEPDVVETTAPANKEAPSASVEETAKKEQAAVDKLQTEQARVNAERKAREDAELKAALAASKRAERGAMADGQGAAPEEPASPPTPSLANNTEAAKMLTAWAFKNKSKTGDHLTGADYRELMENTGGPIAQQVLDGLMELSLPGMTREVYEKHLAEMRRRYYLHATGPDDDGVMQTDAPVDTSDVTSSGAIHENASEDAAAVESTDQLPAVLNEVFGDLDSGIARQSGMSGDARQKLILNSDQVAVVLAMTQEKIGDAQLARTTLMREMANMEPKDIASEEALEAWWANTDEVLTTHQRTIREAVAFMGGLDMNAGRSLYAGLHGSTFAALPVSYAITMVGGREVPMLKRPGFQDPRSLVEHMRKAIADTLKGKSQNAALLMFDAASRLTKITDVEKIKARRAELALAGNAQLKEEYEASLDAEQKAVRADLLSFFRTHFGQADWGWFEAALSHVNEQEQMQESRPTRAADVSYTDEFGELEPTISEAAWETQVANTVRWLRRAVDFSLNPEADAAGDPEGRRVQAIFTDANLARDSRLQDTRNQLAETIATRLTTMNFKNRQSQIASRGPLGRMGYLYAALEHYYKPNWSKVGGGTMPTSIQHNRVTALVDSLNAARVDQGLQPAWRAQRVSGITKLLTDAFGVEEQVDIPDVELPYKERVELMRRIWEDVPHRIKAKAADTTASFFTFVGDKDSIWELRVPSDHPGVAVPANYATLSQADKDTAWKKAFAAMAGAVLNNLIEGVQLKDIAMTKYLKRTGLTTSGGAGLITGLKDGVPDDVPFLVLQDEKGREYFNGAGYVTSQEHSDRFRVSMGDRNATGLKAHVLDESTIVKAFYHLVNSWSAGSGEQILLDALKDKYMVVTDTGSAKLIPSGRENVKEVEIEVNGVKLKGTAFTVKATSFARVSNLDTQSDAHMITNPVQVFSDILEADGALDKYYTFIDRVLADPVLFGQLRKKALDAQSDPSEVVRDQLANYLLGENVPPGFATLGTGMRLALAGMFKKMVSPKAHGILAAMVPSGGDYSPENGLSWLFGVPDEHLSSYEDVTWTNPVTGKEEAIVKSGRMRANMANTRRSRGSRIETRVSEKDLARAEHLIKVRMNALRAAAISTTDESRDLWKDKAKKALVGLRQIATDVYGNKIPMEWSFEDLFYRLSPATSIILDPDDVSAGEAIDSAYDLETFEYTRLGDGSVLLPGSYILATRTPGALYGSHTRQRLAAYVTHTSQKSKDGSVYTVPGKMGLVKLHPRTAWAYGLDYDGDETTVHTANVNPRTGLIDYDLDPRGGVPLDESADDRLDRWRIATGNAVLREQLQAMEGLPLDVLESPIEKDAYDRTMITQRGERKSLEDWSGDARMADALLDPEVYAEAGDTITASTRGREIAVSQLGAYASMLVGSNVTYGHAFMLPGLFSSPVAPALVGGPAPITISRDPSKFTAAGAKREIPLRTMFQNVINILIDDLNDQRCSPLGFSRVMLPLFFVAAAGQNLQSKEHTRRFIQSWADWVHTPLARDYADAMGTPELAFNDGKLRAFLSKPSTQLRATHNPAHVDSLLALAHIAKEITSQSAAAKAPRKIPTNYGEQVAAEARIKAKLTDAVPGILGKFNQRGLVAAAKLLRKTRDLLNLEGDPVTAESSALPRLLSMIQGNSRRPVSAKPVESLAKDFRKMALIDAALGKLPASLLDSLTRNNPPSMAGRKEPLNASEVGHYKLEVIAGNIGRIFEEAMTAYLQNKRTLYGGGNAWLNSMTVTKGALHMSFGGSAVTLATLKQLKGDWLNFAEFVRSNNTGGAFEQDQIAPMLAAHGAILYGITGNLSGSNPLMYLPSGVVVALAAAAEKQAADPAWKPEELLLDAGKADKGVPVYYRTQHPRSRVVTQHLSLQGKQRIERLGQPPTGMEDLADRIDASKGDAVSRSLVELPYAYIEDLFGKNAADDRPRRPAYLVPVMITEASKDNTSKPPSSAKKLRDVYESNHLVVAGGATAFNNMASKIRNGVPKYVLVEDGAPRPPDPKTGRVDYSARGPIKGTVSIYQGSKALPLIELEVDPRQPQFVIKDITFPGAVTTGSVEQKRVAGPTGVVAEPAVPVTTDTPEAQATAARIDAMVAATRAAPPASTPRVTAKIKAHPRFAFDEFAAARAVAPKRLKQELAKGNLTTVSEAEGLQEATRLVLADWDESAESGTARHTELQTLVESNATERPEGVELTIWQTYDWYRKQGLLRAEVPVSTDTYHGTADLLIIRPDGSVDVKDIKTLGEDIFADPTWYTGARPGSGSHTYVSRFTGHDVQLQAYRGALESQNIVVNSTAVIPYLRKSSRGIGIRFDASGKPAEQPGGSKTAAMYYSEIFEPGNVSASLSAENIANTMAFSRVRKLYGRTDEETRVSASALAQQQQLARLYQKQVDKILKLSGQARQDFINRLANTSPEFKAAAQRLWGPEAAPAEVVAEEPMAEQPEEIVDMPTPPEVYERADLDQTARLSEWAGNNAPLIDALLAHPANARFTQDQRDNLRSTLLGTDTELEAARAAYFLAASVPFGDPDKRALLSAMAQRPYPLPFNSSRYGATAVEALDGVIQHRATDNAPLAARLRVMWAPLGTRLRQARSLDDVVDTAQWALKAGLGSVSAETAFQHADAASIVRAGIREYGDEDLAAVAEDFFASKVPKSLIGQLNHGVTAADRGSPSACLVDAQTLFGNMISPLTVQGAPGVARMLVDTAGWIEGVRGADREWYSRLMRYWGLWGDNLKILKMVEFEAPSVDDAGRPTGKTEKLQKYATYRAHSRATQAGQQLGLLLHDAAERVLTHLRVGPNGTDKQRDDDILRAIRSARVYIDLPLDAKDSELLKLIPQELIDAVRAMRDELRKRVEADPETYRLKQETRRGALSQAVVAHPAPYTPEEINDLYHRELYNAGLTNYHVITTQVEGKAVEKLTDIVWTIPVQLVSDHFDGSEFKKQLLAAGRSADKLTLRSLVENVRAQADSVHKGIAKNLPYALQGGDSPFLFRGEAPYGHMLKGGGFMGSREQDAQDILNKAARRAEAANAQSHEITKAHAFDANGLAKPLEKVSDKMMLLMFRLRGIAFPGRELAIENIRNGEYEKQGLASDLDYPGAAEVIRKTLEDKLRSRTSADAARLNEPVVLGHAPADAITNPLGLLKALGSLRDSYKHRETTSRSARKNPYSNDDEAYQKAGLLPNNMGAAEKLHRYVTETASFTMRAAMLNQMLLTLDNFGMPLYVPDPVMLYSQEGIIRNETWVQLARNLSKVTGAHLDPSVSARESVKRMVEVYVAKPGSGYKEIESPYSSVAKFYARVGDSASEAPADMLVAGISGGHASNMLKQVLDIPVDDPWKVLDTLEHTNALMKMGSLQLSVFFPIAAIESIVAAGGMGSVLELAGLKKGISIFQMYNMIRGGHPYFANLVRLMDEAGIPLSATENPLNLPVGMIEKDITKLVRGARSLIGEPAAQAVRAFASVPRAQTHFIFEVIFNTSKVWMALNRIQFERTEFGHRQKAGLKGEYMGDAAALKKWARIIDYSMGGPNKWRTSWWTPTVNRMLGLSMFSPPWTKAAWGIAGGGSLTGQFFNNVLLPHEERFIFLRNWPNMFFYAMVLAPATLQMAAYAMAAAGGGGDDDDKKKRAKDTPWMWQNEAGKELYADITPLVRIHPLYKGAPTGSRRFYTHGGKQAYEVVSGWLEDPWRTFTGKLSQVARWGVEQTTGETVGMGWDMGFKGVPLIESILSDKEGNFEGSRLGHTIGKFAPFSVLAAIQNPDVLPLQAFLPISKGMNFNTANAAYLDYLRTWAQKDRYSQIYKSPKFKANLEALGSEILDAAERNGYDPAAVIKGARAAVMKDLYASMYKAIDNQDLKRVEEVGRSIARVNGTLEGALRSAQNRNKLYGKGSAITPEQRDMLRAAFETP